MAVVEKSGAHVVARPGTDLVVIPDPSRNSNGVPAGRAVLGRRAEKQHLHDLLELARSGIGATLVLRGEPGAGTSTLLQWTVDAATDMRVVRAAAVESERAVSFAGVHQLLLPLLPGIDRLPGPQRHALRVTFGMESGPAPDSFLVGLAVLTLLTGAAQGRPLLCVLDDAHWLDPASGDVLEFVARRLLADRVAILAAAHDTGQSDVPLGELPELRIGGLPDDAGQALLREVSPQIEATVARHVVTRTAGNPLALVQLPPHLTSAELLGRAPLPKHVPLGSRLEQAFARDVLDLPADSRMLVLLAAADEPPSSRRLWQAAAALGIDESAATAAEAAGFATFWPEVTFRHPLVPSAVYTAVTPGERRRAHQALAGACDPDLDAEARAAHLVAAARGPDEGVAADLETAASRAQARGDYAVAARELEAAALLSADDQHRAERTLAAAEARLLDGTLDLAQALLAEAAPDLRRPVALAQASRLDSRLRLARRHSPDACDTLLRASRELLSLDPPAGRQALLSALEGVLWSDALGRRQLIENVALTIEDLLADPAPSSSASDLLLHGFALRVTQGFAPAEPLLRRAVDLFLDGDIADDVALERLGLAVLAAADLLDDHAVEVLTVRWVRLARARGARATLAVALEFRALFGHARRGDMAAARSASTEARALILDGSPGLASGPLAARPILAALRGSDAGLDVSASASAAAAADGTAPALPVVYASGLLQLSAGNYDGAAAALDELCRSDGPFATYALADLVEAADRAGREDLAEEALARLTERALLVRTPLALGLLARARALLAADDDEARSRYEECLDLLDQCESRPQLARAHLLYGEWLRRRRRRREARDHLRQALELFDEMDLARFADRARVELRATGEHITRREDGGQEALTPQEAQIASLVSVGLTNREIAAQLFISPSTVEYHLRKVFTKLGVTSRTQLARLVIDGAGGVTPLAAGAGLGDSEIRAAAGRP